MTIAEQTNGHVKGRIVPPLPLHTFQDSGITVGIRKIAPSTQQRLHDLILREHPKPQPPTVETELGPEVNEADPDYLTRLNEWKIATAGALNAKMFKLACLECEVEVDQQEVERKQAQFRVIGLDWEDDPKLSPEQNAKLFYIQHIACATTDDMKEFYAAVTQRSTPTEEAVARHIDTFRGDVQGA